MVHHLSDTPVRRLGDRRRTGAESASQTSSLPTDGLIECAAPPSRTTSLPSCPRRCRTPQPIEPLGEHLLVDASADDLAMLATRWAVSEFDDLTR